MADEWLELLLTEHTESLEQLAEGHWRGIIPSHGQTLRLFVRRMGPDGSLLRVELSPLLRVPEDPARARAVLREALRRNRTLVEARFALDDDDELILEAIVPAAREALVAALDSLVAAAEAHLAPLARL